MPVSKTSRGSSNPSLLQLRQAPGFQELLREYPRARLRPYRQGQALEEAQTAYLYNSGIAEGERRVLEWLSGHPMEPANGD